MCVCVCVYKHEVLFSSNRKVWCFQVFRLQMIRICPSLSVIGQEEISDISLYLTQIISYVKPYMHTSQVMNTATVAAVCVQCHQSLLLSKEANLRLWRGWLEGMLLVV